MRDVVLVGAKRTPIGSFLGALAPVPAPRLGSEAIRAALEHAQVRPGEVNEVFMGCVLPAGLGQAPARQAALGAGLAVETPCTTINKVCGSGLKAVILASQAIATGDVDIAVAGGMESMSNAPHLLPGVRGGVKMGEIRALDSMVHDGLWDVYTQQHMGSCAELCAREKGFSREAQDQFAAESYRRALAAQRDGLFKDEIVAVKVPGRKGEVLVDTDEEPGRGDISKLPGLRPSFDKSGTVTAGNASSLNDGGAALVLMAREVAERRGARVLARIVAQGNARPGVRVVHHRAGGGHPGGLLARRLEADRRRPVGDQRGVRRGVAGQQPAARPRPQQGERAGRRGRARPPDRRVRRAHPGHPAARDGAARGRARRRVALHRRRRGHRAPRRAGGAMTSPTPARGAAAIGGVGVIGAGQMGRGIAQVAAQAGHDVIIVDASAALAEQGVERIARALERLVSKEKMTAQARDEVVARIRARGAARGSRAAATSSSRRRPSARTSSWTCSPACRGRPGPRRSWPPTRRRSRSPSSARGSSGPSGSSACTS